MKKMEVTELVCDINWIKLYLAVNLKRCQVAKHML